MRLLSLGILTALLAACAQYHETKTPIEQLWYKSDKKIPVEQRQLLVLLPGIDGRLEDYDHYGFIDRVQKKYPGTDVVLVNAHFNYYKKHLLIKRLKKDIVIPAQEKGYCAIHLGGISLGGFGSLLYYRDSPDTIDSITLLAPYLGKEVDYAYLLDDREEAPDSMTATNLWPWLMTLSAREKKSIYLAYGKQDKFAISNGLLAGLLDPDQVVKTDGRHRWDTWEKLWRKGIKSGKLLPLHRYDCQAQSLEKAD